MIDLELKRQMILDHYENPRNKVNDNKKLESYSIGHNDSPSCIDNIDAYVKIKNNKIEDVKFSGVGCAICTSSTDLMTLEIIGKDIKQAKKIIDNYISMILMKPYDEKLLKAMAIYDNVNKQANRIKCAITGVQAILKTIENYEQKNKQ